MPRILVSNDDGVYGHGLKPLIRAMQRLGEVVVVVPDSERSAASHSITLHKPFRVLKVPLQLSPNTQIQAHITNGTPADCVRFGILSILKGKKVDLVASGINFGANLGEDTVYSGTVAAAREGAIMGHLSFGISVADASKAEFDKAEEIAYRVGKQILQHGLPQRIFLNVNVPPVMKKGARLEVTRLGRRSYGSKIPSGIDPRGQTYYWLAGVAPRGVQQKGTDVTAIKAGHVSITPLSVDATSASLLPKLTRWKF